jgi:hypothetical protein
MEFWNPSNQPPPDQNAKHDLGLGRGGQRRHKVTTTKIPKSSPKFYEYDYFLRLTRNLNMPISVDAPAQHKQPSRKGKKAWRKNVDVTEIQEGLEIVRDEVIKGYALSISACLRYAMLKHYLEVLLLRSRLLNSLPSIRLALQKFRNQLLKAGSHSKQTKFSRSALLSPQLIPARGHHRGLPMELYSPLAKKCAFQTKSWTDFEQLPMVETAYRKTW